MATETKMRFLDYLPAVFQTEESTFLGDFLGAFEKVFQEIQLGLDDIPDLFVLLVPRTLQAVVVQHLDAAKVVDVLELDVAAGVCVDDVLFLQDADPTKEEFVVVGLPAELGGHRVALTGKLRFPHAPGTPVAVVRAPATRTVLTNQATAGELPLLSVQSIVTLEEQTADGLQAGQDILLIGEDESVEAAEVRAVFPMQRQIQVGPRLARNYPPGTPVRRARQMFPGQPPPSFLHAQERDRLFLAWLAGWVGWRLREDLVRLPQFTDADWERHQFEWNRRYLQEIFPLVPWRGAQVGLEIFLNAFLQGEATAAQIADHPDSIQVELVSTVGVDTFICGAPRYLFWADFIPTADIENLPDGVKDLTQAVRCILEREKPAHTRFELGGPAKDR